jgi:hypothetical protein
MGVVTRAYSEVDGDIGEASSINRIFDDLYNLVNGSIDSANIVASGVAAVNIQDSAVIARNIDAEAIILIQEVI